MWRRRALVHTQAQTIEEVLPHSALCLIQSQYGQREFVNLAVHYYTVHKSNRRHAAKPLEGSHVRENNFSSACRTKVSQTQTLVKWV